MVLDTPASGQQTANANDGGNVTGAAAEQIGIVTTTASAAPTMGGVDEMATFLTSGSWGGVTQFFDTSQDNVLTFNVTGLTAEGKQLARWALESWEVVANLEFREITGSADITFDDNQAGAFANFTTINNRIVHSDVNISTAWLGNSGTGIGSYSLFTYIHEIGHALGLGHMGAYDGGGTFASNAIYANDSYQMSVMSYFDQRENTTINASYAVPMLPMMVDIVAIQRFYGASTQTAGDTVWGANTTLTGFMATLSSNWQNGTFGTGLPIALTIFDQGGTDLLDLSFSGTGDRIDLRSMQFSDVGGLIGNVAIARGTVIEKLKAGDGSDHITGNGASNALFGGGGFDTIYGGVGFDTVDGGNGRDLVYLEDGNDLFVDNAQSGGWGQDTVFAGGGNDVIRGGGDNDVFHGQSGSDAIFAGVGNDKAYG
ncbi:MAG: M10 family metallopeptidase, partial [Pseudorhodobacter sp.]